MAGKKHEVSSAGPRATWNDSFPGPYGEDLRVALYVSARQDTMARTVQAPGNGPPGTYWHMREITKLSV
jgi:hypothetical protein